MKYKLLVLKEYFDLKLFLYLLLQMVWLAFFCETQKHVHSNVNAHGMFMEYAILHNVLVAIVFYNVEKYVFIYVPCKKESQVHFAWGN